MKFAAAALAALLGAVSARPAPAGHVRHEARDARLKDEWVKRDRVHEGLRVPVRVGLTQSNLEKGEAMLMDVSHPHSANYGKHLSAQEIADLFAPAQSRIDAVGSWLRSALDDKPITLSSTRQWFQFDATIAELQDLLHAEYHEYQHSGSGRTTLGCDEYHVPGHVREHLDFITPGVATLGLGRGRAVRKRDAPSPKIRPVSGFPPASAKSDICDFAITPACVRALYNVTDQLKGNLDNSIGIFETESEFVNQKDLSIFFKQFAPDIPPTTAPEFDAIDLLTPPNKTHTSHFEPDLDFEAVYPLVYPDRVINYQVDDAYFWSHNRRDVKGFFNTFLDALDQSYCNRSAFGETGDAKGIDPTYPDTHPGGWNKPELCGAYKPANVISISYSLGEEELPMNYQRRQCNEWMKLGLAGVSVLVASGDFGVGGDGASCKQFLTQSPMNCPYVTAVGATYLPHGHVAGKDPEAASTEFPSGGGFSNIFGTAPYQVDAVNAYFKNSLPPYASYNITLNATHSQGIYNRGGRGYPDVSAVGQSMATFVSGVPALADGTSASAPFFAGIIARINSFRLDAGKKPVGFINPVLYQHPEVMIDITAGSNPGCGTGGFSAVKGWDPVTGLGTPNYGKMKDLFMSLA